MTKRQLIDEIRLINSTAQPAFLAQFSEADLQEYLNHLRDALSKRTLIHGWTRKPDPMRMVS